MRTPSSIFSKLSPHLHTQQYHGYAHDSLDLTAPWTLLPCPGVYFRPTLTLNKQVQIFLTDTRQCAKNLKALTELKRDQKKRDPGPNLKDHVLVGHHLRTSNFSPPTSKIFGLWKTTTQELQKVATSKLRKDHLQANI